MADSLNRRDIDMIFRAETDSATRSVGELKKSVRDLRGELSEQIKAADRGEISLDKLEQTTRDLKKAQDELGTARSLLTQLNTLTGRAEKSEGRVEKLREELTKLKTEADSTVNPTKRLTNQITRKEKALSAASERAEQDRAALADYKQEVESIVGPVSNLQDSFRDVAKTSKDVSQGLAISGQAADDFADKIKLASAQAADFDDFANFARNSGVLEQDIAYLAQFEDRIERVTAARNEQIAADLRYQDALQGARLEQERIAQTNAFRQTAESAREAFRDVSRFKAETEDSEVSMRRLADAVADLADPARAASRDLGKVAERVEEAASRTDKGGSRRIGALSQDLNQLEQDLAALNRTAKDVDGLRAQQQVADRAEANFAKLKAEVFDLANALENAGEDATDEMAQSLRQAETAAEAAGVAFQREATKLKGLEAAAQAAGIDIKNLDNVEKQIITTSTRAGQAAETLRNKLGTGGRNSTGFLGLKPFELQNLGYQVNDVFTQLASGAPPLQVLAQQGGQIIQLFPGVWSALARGLVVIGPLAVALTALGLGMSRFNERAQELREVRAAMIEVGDAGKYTEEGIVTAIDRLDDIGASAEDARKAVLGFVKDGLDPDFIEDFSVAAQNLAEITGEELPEAAERVTEAFTGGKDAVLALDDEFRFLSDSEREQIRAMDDSTDAAEIRTLAFDAFYGKAQDVAAELRGPSYDAVVSLENAWDDFLDTLADLAGFEDVNDWLTTLTNGVAVFVRIVAGAIRDLRNSLGEFSRIYQEEGLIAALGSINEIAGNERSFAELRADAIAEVVQERTNRAGSGGRTSRGDPGRGTRGNRSLREGIEDAESRRRNRQGKSDAERLAEQLERDTERLTRAIEQMTSQAIKLQQQSVEEQLATAAESVRTQYARLYRDLDEFTATFGADQMIGDRTQAQYRELLQRNEELLIQQAQLQVYEEGVNDLLKERNERLAQIEERQDAGLIDAATAFQQALEVTSELNPEISELAENARQFALAIGGANPSPELREFLAKLDGIDVTITETRSDVNQSALADLNEIEQDRNAIIERRNNLIAANARLVEIGLMTEADARVAAADAYNREAEALRALIEEERAYLQLLLDQGVITQNFYDARLAQLQAVAAEAEYVDDRILQINNAAQGAFTSGFTTMFDTLAQGLAMLVTGGGDVGDMLENLGLAALNFAADFLKAIADVIVQMLALQAFKAIFGASTGGLGAFFFHSGTSSVGSYGGGTHTRSNFSVSPLAVAAAPRYHEGTGGAGLRRNEMLAVLERGERVVTEEQDRLAAKSAKGQATGRGTKLRQVLAFGDSEVAGAMASPAGEEVVVTHIRRNRARIRQDLGIDG